MKNAVNWDSCPNLTLGGGLINVFSTVHTKCIYI